MKDDEVKPGSGALPGSTSSGLLARLLIRDNETWRRFAQLYTPLIYGWCRRRGLQPDDAADTVQEVFRAVDRAVRTFERREGGTFRGWLWTITLNKLRNHYNRRARQPEAVGGSDALAKLAEIPFDDSAEPDEASGAAVLVRQTLHLIQGEFEPRTWQAFWRTAIEEQAVGDVANSLGISANAVYIARSRVLRRLREELEQYEC